MTVTPQQEISKTLNLSKNPQKVLTLYFGEITFTLGEITFTFGEITKILGFWEFLFVAGWGFGTLWVGVPSRGFRKYLTYALSNTSSGMQHSSSSIPGADEKCSGGGVDGIAGLETGSEKAQEWLCIAHQLGNTTSET